MTSASLLDVKVCPEGVCRIVNGKPGQDYVLSKELLESILTDVYAMAMCEEAPE